MEEKGRLQPAKEFSSSLFKLVQCVQDLALSEGVKQSGVGTRRRG